MNANTPSGGSCVGTATLPASAASEKGTAAPRVYPYIGRQPICVYSRSFAAYTACTMIRTIDTQRRIGISFVSPCVVALLVLLVGVGGIQSLAHGDETVAARRPNILFIY